MEKSPSIELEYILNKDNENECMSPLSPITNTIPPPSPKGKPQQKYKNRTFIDDILDFIGLRYVYK